MKIKLLYRKRSSQLFYCLAFMLLFVNTAMAQKTFTWAGATSTDWATPTNWTTSGTSVAPTVFDSGVTTLTLTTANNSIDVGDVVTGSGIDIGTTVTSIDETKTIIGISLPTTSAGTTVTFDFVVAAAANINIPQSSADLVVIDKNDTPFAPSFTGTAAIAKLTISNAFGTLSGATLTINNGASLTVNSGSGTNPISISGGNIVNNGALVVYSSSASGTVNAFAFQNPAVAPAANNPITGLPYTYGYTGGSNSTLNIAFISTGTSSTPFLMNSTNAFSKYNLVFNGTNTFNITTVNTLAVRTIASASPVSISGSGFSTNNGLLLLSPGANVTIESGTNLTTNVIGSTQHIIIMQSTGASITTAFVNKGIINISGTTTQHGIQMVAASTNTLNFENQGTINVDIASAGFERAALGIQNSGTGRGTVNITNSGAMNLTNTQPFSSSIGSALRAVANANTPAVNFINNGSLNLTGNNTNYGGQVNSILTNNGSITSNFEFQLFALTNSATGSISFVNPPAAVSTKGTIFTVVNTVAANLGATYTDSVGVIHTVVNGNKVSGTGTSLYTTSPIATNPATTGTLTLNSGIGDATIAYSARAINGVSNQLNALFLANTNNGLVNTATGSTFLNKVSGATTSGTSVIAPGGSGKGIADFNKLSAVVLGKLRLQVAGNTTAGDDHDKIINSFVDGGFDISGAILEITELSGIASPVDIIVANGLGTISGTFASVTGLTAGWSVDYGTVGKVQLVYTAPVPTITQLGNGIITQGCAGSTLIITGTGFSGATAVTVNSVAVTSFEVNSGTQITAVLPLEATAGAVAVATAAGTATSAGNFTVTANTTNNSETVSACGSFYTWALNGQTYNVSGVYTHAVGCNTATLTLTLTPATTNTTTASGVASYTWANNGQTYTTSGIKTGTTTNCVTELLDLTITTTEIPGSFPAFCKGATVATATGSTTMKFYAAATGGTALAGTIALSNAKTYFVSEVINTVESARVSRLITVNNLPSTPTLLVSSPLDESKLICKYIGSTTPVTFNVTATGASSYLWTVPAGAQIVSGDTTSSVGVSFAGASTVIGAIGAVTVKSVDANGCASLAKSLTITTKAPTAPTSLTLTSADTTDHFNVAIPGTLPIQYTFSSLSDLLKITKVGPYMGTSTVFTLTAPVAPTAASYQWTLPSGTTQLSGGTSNIITVDFDGVPSGIGSLPIVVKSVGGCGLSSARTLTLGRTVPAAPKALTLTNSSQSNLSSLLKITKVGPYTGTSIQFTLTATPFLTQGATSTSYAWLLPAGVTCETASTPKTVYQNVNTGTVEAPVIVSTPFAAIETPTNVITVNFSTASGIGNLELAVFGINGAGNSVARKLVLARALPTNPTKLVLTDGATVVTKASPYVGKSTSLTLTATPFTTQGAEATSFTWTLPAGVNVTAGATQVSGTISTPTTWTGTATALTINFDGVAPAVFSLPLSVQSVNGAGTPITYRTITVTAAAPTAPAIVGSTGTTYSSCVNTTYTATSFQGATYTWSIPAGAAIVGASDGNVIVVNYAAVSVPVGGSAAVTCIATNGVGSSPTKSLTVKRVTGSCRLSNSSASKFSAKAYPNPSSSEFTIETSAKGAMNVKVYDMQGRLVEKTNTDKVGSKLAAGAYNVIVNQGANTKSVRVIKK